MHRLWRWFVHMSFLWDLELFLFLRFDRLHTFSFKLKKTFKMISINNFLRLITFYRIRTYSLKTDWGSSLYSSLCWSILFIYQVKVLSRVRGWKMISDRQEKELFIDELSSFLFNKYIMSLSFWRHIIHLFIPYQNESQICLTFIEWFESSS